MCKQLNWMDDGCMFDLGLDCFSLIMAGGAVEYESKETTSHAYHVFQPCYGCPATVWWDLPPGEVMVFQMMLVVEMF